MLTETFDKLSTTFHRDNLKNLSDQELIYGQKDIINAIGYYRTLELTAKVSANSLYGAFGTNSNRYFLQALAEDICSEGRYYIKLMDKLQNDYFKGAWLEDTEFLEELRQQPFGHIIPEHVKKPKLIDKDYIVYIDTDSVDKDTVLETSAGRKTIEDFYNENVQNGSAGETLTGHESVYTPIRVLNYTKERGLYYADVKRIIRHTVTKDKWCLKTKSGKEVFVTNDHSMIVFRDGEQIEVKPADILSTDLVLTINDSILFMCVHGELDDIESCTRVGTFEDEYVYDIEVDDESHTFIANDILVHNSTYARGDLILQSLDIDYRKHSNREIVDFLEYVYTTKMRSIFNNALETTISKRHGHNVMDFELEVVGGKGIFIEKKKYIFTVLSSDGEYVGHKGWFKNIGIEIQQSGSSKLVHSVLKAFINAIFTKWDTLDERTFFSMCNSVKKQLSEVPINDLAKINGIKTYDKYVICDRERVEHTGGPSAIVKGAMRYNHLIYTNNLQNKYPYIKQGMRCKWYYDVNGDAFSYPDDVWPYEIAPEMDRDTQLDKLIFDPVKRYISGLFKADLKQMGKKDVQYSFNMLMKHKK